MYDVIVVGAGTAGMTAALNALRAGKSVLVLECNGIGGQIANSPRVENYPSIKSISGSEFSDNLFAQIEALGVNFEFDKVTDAKKRADGSFLVIGEYGEYEGRSLVIATGVRHKTLGIQKEEELVGKGVSYCAVCDGAFYAGEEVALIGDANTAVQYAILLAGYCKKVYVCTLFDKFFADKIIVDKMLAKENVEWISKVSCVDLVGEEKFSGCVFEGDDGKRFTLSAAACFVAIGQKPDNAAFMGLVDVDDAGYIVASDECVTRTEGVFAAGDCRQKKLRQLTTAVADGSIAAMAALKYID